MNINQQPPQQVVRAELRIRNRRIREANVSAGITARQGNNKIPAKSRR